MLFFRGVQYILSIHFLFFFASPHWYPVDPTPRSILEAQCWPLKRRRKDFLWLWGTPKCRGFGGLAFEVGSIGISGISKHSKMWIQIASNSPSKNEVFFLGAIFFSPALLRNSYFRGDHFGALFFLGRLRYGSGPQVNDVDLFVPKLRRVDSLIRCWFAEPKTCAWHVSKKEQRCLVKCSGWMVIQEFLSKGRRSNGKGGRLRTP